MTTKPNIDDATTDIEAFDELDRNFHKVVQDLVSDHSLDSFRKEYEKLHDSLVESHAHNVELIEKCRSLNNDILANANKVSSVMSLSQNDQRVIAGLRHEFEKAWKLVEVSQDREAKSKEVIEGLKGEIANLSRLVEHGESKAFSQQTSLEEVQSSITSIKSEIAVQAQQLTQMKEGVEKSAEDRQMITDELKKLQEENESLQEELDEQRTINANMNTESESIRKEIAQAKNNIKASQDLIASNTQAIEDKRTSNLDLETVLMEENLNIKSCQEDKKMCNIQVQLIKKSLEDTQKGTVKTNDEIHSYDDRFRALDITISSLRTSLNQINEDTEENTLVLAEAKKVRDSIQSDKQATRDRLNQCRSEVYKLTSQCSAAETEIRMLKRTLDRARNFHRDIKSQVSQISADRVNIEGQTTLIGNELVDVKSAMHKDRGKCTNVSDEIDKYQGQTFAARSNEIQLRDEIKSNERETDINNMQLSDMYEDIKKQDSVCEAIRNERDLACRQFEISKKDNANLFEENKILIEQIKQLKEDIREKDKDCLTSHYMQKQIESALVKYQEQIEEFQQKLKITDDQNTEYRNRIQRALYLISQAELDIMKQKQVVHDLTSSQFSYGLGVTKKTEEIAVLKEKIHLVTGYLHSMRLAYNKQTEEINELQEKLAQEVARVRQLKGRMQHHKALRLESIRVQKALLSVQGRSRALEDELEKPLNVHRWRFLEGTNPELAQLIRMNIELRDRLMLKITVLQRLKEHCDTIQKKANVQSVHLQKGYSGDYQQEWDFYTSILQQKQQQLHELGSRVNGQQSSVVESREQVQIVRGMVRDEKAQYFGQKKKADMMRATTAMANRRKDDDPAGNATHYVGGGFAVSGIQKGPSPPKKSQSSLGTPHIVSPKSGQFRKKAPNNWNPSRAPLQPFLPTVSSN